MGTCYVPSSRFHVNRAYTLLQELWSTLSTEKFPLALDRFLSHRLGRPGPESKEERLWAGRRLDEIFRYGHWLLLQLNPPAQKVNRAQSHVECLLQLPLIRVLSLLREKISPFPDPLPYKLPKPNKPLQPPPVSNPFLSFGFPATCLPLIESRKQHSHWHGPELQHFLHLSTSRSPLWLRINQLPWSQEIWDDFHKAQWQLFDEAGKPVLNHTALHINQALRAHGLGGFQERLAYRQGLVEVQDLSTQLMGRALISRLPPKPYIWDACAGAGGKSLQLACALNNQGMVYASDIHSAKIESLRRRAARAQLRNIRSFAFDVLKDPLEFGKHWRQHGGFDAVVVDAPCSGSGTWRKNPEGKFYFSPEILPALQHQQTALLCRAYQALKPGGILLYGTCSFMVEENEAVVEQFLQHQTDAALVEQSLLGAPILNAETAFVACLQKNKT